MLHALCRFSRLSAFCLRLYRRQLLALFIDRIVRKRFVLLHIHRPEKGACRSLGTLKTHVLGIPFHAADQEEQSLSAKFSGSDPLLMHVLFRPKRLAPVYHYFGLRAHTLKEYGRSKDDPVRGPDIVMNILHVVQNDAV